MHGRGAGQVFPSLERNTVRPTTNLTRATATASLCACLLANALPTGAFTVNITQGSPRTIYLQVGVGSFTGNYTSGGAPASNPTINTVSVTVPANAVGTGVAQTMTTNSTTSNSFYDGYAFCNAPAQLYIGGFYRISGTAASTATLTAVSPASLTSPGGDAIPFTQIRWTSSGNGDTGAQPFPAGTFAGGTQTIGTINRNQWAESCHTFSYLNANFVAAGTYTGRVTYTLSAP